jgi:hypothetical protein
MKRLSMMAVALLALGAARASFVHAASAEGNSGSASATDPEEQVKALEQEFEAAQREVAAKLKELATDDERKQYYSEHRPDPKQFAARFLAIADANPKTEAAARALVWVVTRAQDAELTRPAFERLAADHSASPHLAKACGRLQSVRGAWVDEALEQLVDRSASADVRGQALMTLALRALQAEYTGSKRTSKQAEELLEQVIRDYADAGGGKLKQRAERELFELRNLAIGKVAPDIQGEDLDGVRFQLSDYRGKVVVLDFWGNW